MWQYNYNVEQELYHHGIKGQKWGVRRFQNPDGTLTEAGRKHLEKKDDKWINRKYDKIYNNTYKKSRKELNKYVKKELDPMYKNRNKGMSYVNSYNKKMAEIMSANASDLRSPSGKVIKFVAKRGEAGVYMALATEGYDMNSVKNGVWESGRIAYKKKSVKKM